MKRPKKETINHSVVKIEKQQKFLEEQQAQIQNIIIRENEKIKSNPAIPTFSTYNVQVIEIPNDHSLVQYNAS